ncbi:uncharacterized protein LOC127131123 [Lathyrus oleraceus]|uniref:uncharacterized protein LOC127131123 n=1 Tax=Pisum sativum TaxID=3888 RepID=UPI0021D3624B|nr:uncharacterized protein LOC127131123 [Pisum sativum]
MVEENESTSCYGSNNSKSSPAIAPPPRQKKLSKNAPDNRTDIAWKHGIADPDNPSKIQCKYCQKMITGGVYRLKHHLAGTQKYVEACKIVLDEIKREILQVCSRLQENLIKKIEAMVEEEMSEAGSKRMTGNNSGNIFKKSYKSIWNIIDDKWDKRLHMSLHAAAYYLNPHMHYGPRFKADIEVRKDLMDCLTKMVDDPKEQSKIEVQMHDFKKQLGYFGTELVKRTLEKSTPANWWDSVGSSGCERNWSAFEMIVQKTKGGRTFEIEFDDLGFDDDWLMDEDDDIEISDEDFIQMNQEQIQEDDIFVHDLEDEHDGGIDENEFDDDFEDENEDEGDNEDNDDPLSDYDQLQHELFGN